MNDVNNTLTQRIDTLAQQTIDAMEYHADLVDAVRDLVELCAIERDGTWSIPVFIGGKVQTSREVTATMHRLRELVR